MTPAVGGLGGGTSAAQTFSVVAPPPAPTLTGVTPQTVSQGTASRVLTVTGANFIGSTVGQVNGGARATVVESGTQLSVTLAAGDVASGGTLSLTVFTPAPGGGTSSAATVTVLGPTLTLGQTAGPGAGPLSVTFSNGPGGGWVGLFPTGTSGPNGYVDWQWVTGSQTLSAQVVRLTSRPVTFPRAGMGPVPVGTYVYRWVKDGMVIEQSATLTVADIPSVAVLTSQLTARAVAGAGAGAVHLERIGSTLAEVVRVHGQARPT